MQANLSYSIVAAVTEDDALSLYLDADWDEIETDLFDHYGLNYEYTVLCDPTESEYVIIPTEDAFDENPTMHLNAIDILENG